VDAFGVAALFLVKDLLQIGQAEQVNEELPSLGKILFFSSISEHSHAALCLPSIHHPFWQEQSKIFPYGASVVPRGLRKPGQNKNRLSR
jgi:hypothetical protein